MDISLYFDVRDHTTKLRFIDEHNGHKVLHIIAQPGNEVSPTFNLNEQELLQLFLFLASAVGIHTYVPKVNDDNQ